MQGFNAVYLIHYKCTSFLKLDLTFLNVTVSINAPAIGVFTRIMIIWGRPASLYSLWKDNDYICNVKCHELACLEELSHFIEHGK